MGVNYTFLHYHQVTPEVFRSHVEYLKKHYTLCGLDQLRRGDLPKNPMFITFDDGWASNYDLCSIITFFQVPVTLFLLTGSIGDEQMLTETEVKVMSHYVDIQSHGVSHTPATELNPADFVKELTESRKVIEKITGKEVYAFAYPYNRATLVEAAIVKLEGYELARAGGRKINDKNTYRHLISSIGVVGTWSVLDLRYALVKAQLKTWRYGS